MIVKAAGLFQKIKSNVGFDMEELDEVITSYSCSKTQTIAEVSNYIFSAGGKRIRPLLTILSAKCFGYSGAKHICLAAAVEFIHTATLLHDDVVDNSEMRRGKPTAQSKWGNKASILVGDYLFSQAFCLMAKAGSPHILDILSTASSIIAEGEVAQLENVSKLSLTREKYLEIISSKTAELFSAACQVGAALADVSDECEYAFANFGRNLGVSFQIIDDVLDYTGNSEIFGKTLGNDFEEGKVTLPVIITYQKAASEEKSFLEKVFAERVVESEDFDKLLSLFKKHNALDEAISQAKKYASLALAELAVAPDNIYKEILKEIIDFAIDRKH